MSDRRLTPLSPGEIRMATRAGFTVVDSKVRGHTQRHDGSESYFELGEIYPMTEETICRILARAFSAGVAYRARDIWAALAEHTNEIINF